MNLKEQDFILNVAEVHRIPNRIPMMTKAQALALENRLVDLTLKTEGSEEEVTFK